VGTAEDKNILLLQQPVLGSATIPKASISYQY
jgi:hypothetical protein